VSTTRHFWLSPAMLRTVLAGVQSPTWPLAEELALLDTLFALHRLRDPDKLRLVRHLPDPLPDVHVPPMLLLPLAENSVKHGPAAGHRGDIVLDVQTSAADGHLVISLANPGRYTGRRVGGTGLEIVERRLALAYDGQAMFTIAAVDDRTIVELTLPLSGPAHGGTT
jgi:two-component system sensor histidine kinase AlgZ